MANLETFRKTCRAVHTNDPTLPAVAKTFKVEFFFEGWDVIEEGYSEVFFYAPTDDQTVIIMKRVVRGESEFVYSWLHPCDEYAPTLHEAEQRAFHNFIVEHDCDMCDGEPN